jgi:hypothetical protein
MEAGSLKVDTFDFAAVTIGEDHVSASGTLIHRTSDTGRADWEASAVADDVPPSIRHSSGKAWDVAFHAGPRSLRGKAFVTIGATTAAGTTAFPIDFRGTDELDGI